MIHLWVLETVFKKEIFMYKATWSLKYSDQYLLLQFCSRKPVNFLQADWNYLDKKMKKIFFLKFRHPRRESNPGLWVNRQVSTPLDYEGFIKTNDKNDKIYKFSKLQRACRKFTSFLEQNCLVIINQDTSKIMWPYKLTKKLI